MPEWRVLRVIDAARWQKMPSGGKALYRFISPAAWTISSTVLKTVEDEL